MYDILSLSLYQSSAIILRVLLPFYDLDNHSVLFVRWFWAPFFEQVVHALGLLVVTSVSDVASRQEALSPLRLSI